jgi:hypothetical protein
LLFAGTEIGVFVSFDDGEQWQPLQMNLPVTSVRDLVIHGTDLVVGTHGRSFWILDDITPLRQASTSVRESHLIAPQKAMRWRYNRNSDTPLPPEEPAGQNPPDGAIIDYSLQADQDLVSLEIFDANNTLVRRYTSKDKPAVTEEELEKDLNVPTYWVRPTETLSDRAGTHRFVWDLRYAPPSTLDHQYPISATYRNTPRLPAGTLVKPGTYTIKLTAGGRTFIQKLTVEMDPRIKTTPVGVAQQFSASQRLSDMMQQDYDTLSQVRALEKVVDSRSREVQEGELKTALSHAVESLGRLGGSGRGRRRGGEGGAANLASLNGELALAFGIIQDSDNPPTTQALAAVSTLNNELRTVLTQWKVFEEHDLPDLNKLLRGAKQPELTVPPVDRASLRNAGTNSYDADVDEN